MASVGVDLLIASVGGVAIGVLAFLVIGLLRKHLTEVPADTALSFVAPYLAYVPAEQVGASGVLAVVTAGLLLAHKAPIIQTAPSRLSERINWSSITFVLENSVFLLIGLQIAGLLDDVVNDDELSTGRTLVVGLVVLVTCLVLRPVWMIPFTLLSNRRADATVDRADRLRGGAVGAWAGMRGVVTLAAALTLPEETPLRAQLVVIALVVTVGTLLLQGSTLPWLARRLDVRGPDPREDALQEATVLGATTGAGLRLIEADPSADDATVAAIRDQATARVNRSWERLGTLGPGDDETPSEARARVRTEMIREERAELLRIRDLGGVDHEVLTSVLGQLDAEESALIWNATRAGAVRRVTPAPARPDRRRVRAPGRRRDAQGADHCRGLPHLPGRGAHLGAPAVLRRVRPGRVLRLLDRQARRGALPRDRPPGHAQHRAGRGLAVVLRRRAPRLTAPADRRVPKPCRTGAGGPTLTTHARPGPRWRISTTAGVLHGSRRSAAAPATSLVHASVPDVRPARWSHHR